LARHAKRITLKVEDLRLLRQLWKVIDPNSPIGTDTPENRYVTEKEKEHAAARLEREKAQMVAKVDHLTLIGRLDKLSRTELIFLREHKLANV
jgi:hypothetical protein